MTLKKVDIAGRQRRRQMKRTHIEIVVQEAKKSKEDRK